MNFLFLLLIVFSTFSNTKKGVSNFEYQLIEITRNFKERIMDKDECEKLKREADDLVDEIELAMEMEEEYTPAEMAELKKLKIEAEAMEEYIGAVGNCGNYIPTIANFNLANRRVRGTVVLVSKDKFCVDIIKVTINEYVAYLAENNSAKNYSVTYKWGTSNGMNNGSGSMGLMKLSVRHIYNSRDEENRKNITVLNMNCKEF